MQGNAEVRLFTKPSRLVSPGFANRGMGIFAERRPTAIATTISAQLLKALEAEEKRMSPSRGFHCIEKAQTSALPFSRSLGKFFAIMSNV